MHFRKEILGLLIGFFILSSASAFFMAYQGMFSWLSKSNQNITYNTTNDNQKQNKILTSDICIAKQGRIVNTLSKNCHDNEENIGNISGLRCPCICCVEKEKKDNKQQEIKNFDECIQAGYPVSNDYPKKCTVINGKTFIEKIKDFNQANGILSGNYCEKDEECDLDLLDIDKEKCDYQVKCINHKCQAVCPIKAVDRLKNCKNLCGDGLCQEVTCLGYSCPCSESKDSCPIDCK